MPPVLHLNPLPCDVAVDEQRAGCLKFCSIFVYHDARSIGIDGQTKYPCVVGWKLQDLKSTLRRVVVEAEDVSRRGKATGTFLIVDVMGSAASAGCKTVAKAQLVAERLQEVARLLECLPFEPSLWEVPKLIWEMQ